MSQPTGSTDTEYTSVTVSPEFRDKLRVAKAERGESYEQYLKRHVPIETDD